MREWAELLVARAREEGVALTGEGGLLTGLMRQVLQTGLEARWPTTSGMRRMSAQRAVGRATGAMAPTTRRSRPRSVRSSCGCPGTGRGRLSRGRCPSTSGGFEGLAGNVISLYAKGLTTGEIQQHLAELYGSEVSRDTISRITDQIVEEMVAWQSRPLDRLYAVLLIDCLVIKVRGSQVANRPVYVAVGVNLEGERDVLGLWLGPSGGEGAKQWATMLTELRNRGLVDALIVCCDGLKGLPDSIRTTWPEATVQTCVVHMVRNSLRYASKKHWGRITAQMREIYTAPTVEAAESRFAEFAGEWRELYPAMISAWESVWEEFVPFLAFPAELRKVVYTTNAVESLNARFRRAVRHRGHFPTEQAALKVLYLVATQRRKNRQDMTGSVSGWKQILNTLQVHYGDRISG